MKKYLFLITIITLSIVPSLFSGCQQASNSISNLNQNELLIKGDSITTSAQQVLLRRVAEKIQLSGTTGAVEYCNEQAIPLTDSVAQHFGYILSRLSIKNRNPKNAIHLSEDKNAWTEIEKRMQDENDITKHFIIQYNNDLYYYKAITIAMPTCLKCHGDKENDIASETLQKIQVQYPDDKATGYKMGDLRGMWKVKLN